MEHVMNKAINVLHDAFDAINEKYYDGILEPCIITIQSNGKNKNSMGHCTVQKVWKEKEGDNSKIEINIAAEFLSRPVLDIMCTLNHEMVHHFCASNDIKDTSNNFVYHNKKFRDQAEARGLSISEQKTIGWSITTAKPEFEEFIKSLNIDENAFSMYRVSVSNKIEKKKKPRKPKIEWTCSCGTIIKSKKDDLKIKCCECNENFVKKVTEGLDGDNDGE